MVSSYQVVDLFCGAGGLAHGLMLEGFQIRAGYDIDPYCQYPFQKNNPGAVFVSQRVEELSPCEIASWYSGDAVSVLAGCAPCQPFSRYAQGRTDKEQRWRLVKRFADLVSAVLPDVVTMENVPDLVRFRQGLVFRGFVSQLESAGYHVYYAPCVFCPDYGIPQTRSRLVLIASRLAPVTLIEPTHNPEQYLDVHSAIGDLESLQAGEASETDRLHRAAKLSRRNLARIRASKPGGSWNDWPPELVAGCHRRSSGVTYQSVYGRMRWDEPSPTITTQAYAYGSGRFGHPEQDRALTLREAALLQTFPPDYEFVPPDEPVYFRRVGALIGNAVPVALGRAIAKSIEQSLVSPEEG